MRVLGDGSARGWGDRHQDPRRAARFRAAHKIGQRVRGRFLRWEAPGLAWVEVDGHRLLASLENAPPSDTVLLFEIIRLVPEIVLRHLPAEPTARSTGLALLHGFHRARAGFEDKVAPLGAELTALSPENRRERMIGRTADPGTVALWREINTDLDRLNALLNEHGRGRLEYLPWLLPRARGVFRHTAEVSQTMTRQTLECELKGQGNVRLVRLFGQGGDSYRLQGGPGLDERAALKALADATGAWTNSEYLGVARLTPSAHGGLPAELILAV